MKGGTCEKHKPEYQTAQGKDLTGFSTSGSRTKESRGVSKGSKANKHVVRIPTK